MFGHVIAVTDLYAKNSEGQIQSLANLWFEAHWMLL